MNSLQKTKHIRLLPVIILTTSLVLCAEPIDEETSDNMKKLWEARITSPAEQAEQKNNPSADKINDLINKIESLDFETPSPEKTKEKSEQKKSEKQQPDNAETLSKTNDKQEETTESEQKSKQNEQKDKITAEKQQNQERIKKIVKEIASNPKQAENPLELAEILFRSGHTEYAAVFYEYVLNEKDLSSSDKAWVLFQLGNCFEQSAPSKAREYYENLLIKYKDCQWIKTTETKLKTLQMKQENKINDLLSESKELNPAGNDNLLSKAK
jgi:hypothetical protein